MKIPSILISLALLGAVAAHPAEVMPTVVRAPALLELRDQFDAPQRLAFPNSNLVVLTIADRKGSEQIDRWVAALNERYGGRIDLRGMADVGGVPGFLRGKVRKKFQETRQHPVMMDWSGTNCVRFGAQTGTANVLVLARDGVILSSHRGPADDKALKSAFTVIDSALSGASTNSAINLPVQSLSGRKDGAESSGSGPKHAHP